MRETEKRKSKEILVGKHFRGSNCQRVASMSDMQKVFLLSDLVVEITVYVFAKSRVPKNVYFSRESLIKAKSISTLFA